MVSRTPCGRQIQAHKSGLSRKALHQFRSNGSCAWNQAIKCHEKRLEIAKNSLGDQGIIVETITQIAADYSELGRWGDSERYHRMLFNQQFQGNESGTLNQARYYDMLAGDELNQRHYKEARLYSEKSLAIKKFYSNDPGDIACTCVILATVSTKLKNFSQAEKYVDETLQLSVQGKFKDLETAKQSAILPDAWSEFLQPIDFLDMKKLSLCGAISQKINLEISKENYEKAAHLARQEILICNFFHPDKTSREGRSLIELTSSAHSALSQCAYAKSDFQLAKSEEEAEIEILKDLTGKTSGFTFPELKLKKIDDAIAGHPVSVSELEEDESAAGTTPPTATPTQGVSPSRAAPKHRQAQDSTGNKP